MSHRRTGKCRSCGARFVWGRTEERPNKPSCHIPLDPPVITIRHDPAGLYTIMDSNGVMHRGSTCHRDDGGAVAGRVPHHSTCPDAEKHRKAHSLGRKAKKAPKKSPDSGQRSLF